MLRNFVDNNSKYLTFKIFHFFLKIEPALLKVNGNDIIKWKQHNQIHIDSYKVVFIL